MDISINGARVWFEIPLFGGIPVTATQVNSILVIIAIAVLCKWLTYDLKVRPTSKRQIVAEWLVEKATNLVSENMGANFLGFTPFIAAILALSACSSLLALLGMYAPTADLNTVLGWALLVFAMITFYKIKTNGFLGYLKSFTGPVVVFTPFNILGEVATPVSMAFRHFGNVVSGSVISALVYAALAALSNLVFGWLPGLLGKIPFLQVGIPAVLSIYFDVFSSCIQAFIFAMLTMLYIASAATPEEE